MSYMRKITGRCFQVRIREHTKKKLQEFRYSVEVRQDAATITEFAWRLDCGHVLDGQQGHGKKKKMCWHCESLADGQEYTPRQIARISTDWTDIKDEAEYEEIRQKAIESVN